MLLPVFNPHSDFYKHYSKRSVPDLLREHGFSVVENAIDDEDIVYIEQYKEYLMGMGIVNVTIPFRKEFIGEYPLSANKSIFVQGHYLRLPTGEKMYSSYYYTFYSWYKRTGEKYFYLERADKSKLLKYFEKYLQAMRRKK
ncbi:TPA: hypothetical protein IU259_001046 [Enterococcus faecalis]|nr:hypothetical protein [Enterococcus faecalis]